VTPRIDTLTAEGAKKSRPMKRGDVVIAVSGQPGVPCILNANACIHDGFVGLRDLDVSRLQPEYLYYYLTHIRERSGFRAVGAIFKNLTTHQIAALQIPLPPLAEQKRIAAILDKADAIRRKRQQAIALSEEFLRSAFFEMFGDPVTNPKEWEVSTIGDQCDVQGGLQVTAKRKSLPITLPYLRVANVYRDQLKLHEIKTINVTRQEFERTRLLNGDVLIVEGHGNRNEIGRCAVWDGSIEGCVHQNHLIRVRPKSSVLHSVFLSTYLNSAGGCRQMQKAGKTTSGLNTISTTNVKETEILVPSYTHQQAYARLVQASGFVSNRAGASTNELENLFNSLVQRAFRGEL
jgi:type I restriction enzyme, S subunit